MKYNLGELIQKIGIWITALTFLAIAGVFLLVGLEMLWNYDSDPNNSSFVCLCAPGLILLGMGVALVGFNLRRKR